MPRPLIHIGFPKAGSTFLHEYFLASEVALYSDDDLLSYRKSGILHVKSLEEDDRVRVISDEQLVVWAGGTAKSGLEEYNIHYEIRKHQQRVAEDLKENLPDARVLIVVRSPVTLLVSLYSQYLSNAGYLGFKQFLNGSGEKIFKLFDYGFVIPLYQKLFGVGNVLVLPYELLASDSTQFLKLMESFAELPHLGFESKKVNKSIPVRAWPWVRLVSLVTRVFISPFSLKLRKKLFDRYLEKLYRAKENWHADKSLIKKLGVKSLAAIENCILSRYSFYAELKDHEHVRPYIEKYDFHSNSMKDNFTRND